MLFIFIYYLLMTISKQASVMSNIYSSCATLGYIRVSLIRNRRVEISK
jgi:hypothetical protein